MLGFFCHSLIVTFITIYYSPRDDVRQRKWIYYIYIVKFERRSRIYYISIYIYISLHNTSMSYTRGESYTLVICVIDKVAVYYKRT